MRRGSDHGGGGRHGPAAILHCSSSILLSLMGTFGAVVAAAALATALADGPRKNLPLVPYRLEPLRWGSVTRRFCK